ncbi:MAG: hypothetical protein ACPL3Q_07945, partial [Candidatus Ratteibacteria bacterium]
SRLADKKINIQLTDTARNWLAEHGYDPNYGARPLKRLIQKEIENPLAIKLLSGEFPEGSKIEIDESNNTLVFRQISPQN